MTPQERAYLVNQITSTWPLGVKGHVWTSTLEELDDYDRARTTLELLRMSDDQPPSVARFRERYLANADTPTWERPAYTGPPTPLADVIDALAWRAAPGEDVHELLEVWRRLRPAAVAEAIARHPSQQPNTLQLDHEAAP